MKIYKCTFFIQGITLIVDVRAFNKEEAESEAFGVIHPLVGGNYEAYLTKPSVLEMRGRFQGGVVDSGS